MCVCVFALFCYIAGAVAAGAADMCQPILCSIWRVRSGWVSALAGFTGLLVRWHESYLFAPDAGRMPVSTLYEVFILFLVITALMYLYYEKKFAMQKLGGFVFPLAVVVVFVLWYSVARGACHSAADSGFAIVVDEIHVPADFCRLRC